MQRLRKFTHAESVSLSLITASITDLIIDRLLSMAQALLLALNYVLELATEAWDEMRKKLVLYTRAF